MGDASEDVSIQYNEGIHSHPGVCFGWKNEVLVQYDECIHSHPGGCASDGAMKLQSSMTRAYIATPGKCFGCVPVQHDEGIRT